MIQYLIKVTKESRDGKFDSYVSAESIGTAISHIGGREPFDSNITYTAQVLGVMTHPALHVGGTIAEGLNQ